MDFNFFKPAVKSTAQYTLGFAVFAMQFVANEAISLNNTFFNNNSSNFSDTGPAYVRSASTALAPTAQAPTDLADSGISDLALVGISVGTAIAITVAICIIKNLCSDEPCVGPLTLGPQPSRRT